MADETIIKLGDAEVTRVVEWAGKVATAQFIVPESGPRVWRENESWLAPDFWDPRDDGYRCHVQTWVVRTEGMTVLVDTGIGNDRDRPQIPQFAGLRTDFLGRLMNAGVRPEDVDVVINTHIHYDHVGWNTRPENGEWVPTFPNATYFIPRPDYEYFDPRGTARTRAPRSEHERTRWEGSKLVFNDSIAPVVRAGQAVLWEDGYRVAGSLTLEPAPGHTPGSSVVRLRSGSDHAVFVGDILHSPVQVIRPDCNSCFCDDPAAAARTRRAILDRAADRRELVVPAHFPGRGVVEVHRDGDTFTVRGRPAGA